MSRLTGMALADATLEHIAANKKDWEQEEWRCGSGMCFAGWAATLNGVRWFAGPDGPYSEYVLARSDDPEEHVKEIMGKRVVHVSDRAARVLGLDYSDDYDLDADILFAGGNRLPDLRRMVKRLKAGKPLL